MQRHQIEKLYKVNGLEDFELRNTDDLLKVHGIDFKAVNGYLRLDDINRHIYQKFIINIFNAFGLESRASLVPKGIYFVEDIDYLSKENPEEDYYTVVGCVIYVIDKNGLKTVHKTWVDEDYEHHKIIESEGKTYLRFEYELNGRAEWLHVIKDGREWY